MGVLLSSVEFWKARGCHVFLDSLSGLVLAISGHFGRSGDQEVIRFVVHFTRAGKRCCNRELSISLSMKPSQVGEAE